MPVNVPVSEWRRTSGNGELGTTSGNVTTLNGLQIITLAGADLVISEGSYTAVPATEWAVVDSVSATEWRPTDGLSDFSDEGASDIVDTTGEHLVDTTSIQIVDTGVLETEIPATDWIQDDSI